MVITDAYANKNLYILAYGIQVSTMYCIGHNLEISPRIVSKYLILYSLALILGRILGSFIFLVPVAAMMYCLYVRNVDKALIFLVFWSYVFQFFKGQGWIDSQTIFRYLVKPNLYILILLFLTLTRLNFKDRLPLRCILWSVFMTLAIFLGYAYHSIYSITMIAYPVYIYLFVLIVSTRHNLPHFLKILFNLLIAIALLQLLLSILQVTGAIPRPLALNVDMRFYDAGMESGADDAATGTMGTARSTVTSWICTIVSMYLLSYAIQISHVGLAAVSLVFLFQYMTVDSKTGVAMTGIALILLLALHGFRKMLLSRRIRIFVVLVLGIAILYFGIQYYYAELISPGRAGRQIPISRVRSTFEVVSENTTEWGKVAGFVYLTKDFFDSDWALFLVGYGHEQYDYFLEDIDPEEMQLNNLTRSKSSIIYFYAQFGVIGLLLLFGLFLMLYRDIRRRRYATLLGASFRKCGTAILITTVVFMFLYPGITIKDEAFAMFLNLYAIVILHERGHSKVIRTNKLAS